MKHIPWDTILKPFPGEGREEKLRAAKQGKTWTQLARELNQDVNATKAIFYRGIQHQTKTYIHCVPRQVRPNYAAILGDLIRSLAEEQKMSEEEYRAHIKTPEGEEVFRFCCAWYGIPLFGCHYQRKLQTGKKSMGK